MTTWPHPFDMYTLAWGLTKSCAAGQEAGREGKMNCTLYKVGHSMKEALGAEFEGYVYTIQPVTLCLP